MLVTETLCLPETHTVDDRRMVQLIGYNGILVPEQRLENTAVGIEGGGIQNAVLRPQESRDLLLQLSVNVLRTTDKTDPAHSVAPGINSLMGRLDHLGMTRETQ